MRRALLGLILVGAIIVPAIDRTTAQIVATGDLPRYVDPSFHDQLYPVNVNNQWGLMNQHGFLVVYPRFDWTDYSYGGVIRVVERGWTAFIAGDGEWRFKQSYRYADHFVNGYAIVGDGDGFGFIDRAGTLRLPMRLDGVLRFREGMAAVCVDGRCGFIDQRMELAIPLRFVRVRSFHDGLAAVQWPGGDDRPGAWGYIDKTGEARFVDRQGAITALGDFHEGLAPVRIGERWGYFDQAFNLRIAPRFEAAREFADGVAAVKLNQSWGYINKTGDFAIAPRFDQADDFDATLALVKVGQAYGYVNRVGDWGIVPQFKDAWPFFRDYARVYVEPSFGYIDVSGHVLWDPRQARHGFIRSGIEEFLRSRTQNRFYDPHVGAPPPRPRPDSPPPYPPDHTYEQLLPYPRGWAPQRIEDAQE